MVWPWLRGWAALVLLVLVSCERRPQPADSQPSEAAQTPAESAVADAGRQERPETPWYEDLTFNAACERAAAEGRIVLALAYRDDDPVCGRLQRHTLNDASVREFLGRNTVPIRFDVRSEAALARRYEIAGVPTVLFLRADGSEIERITGLAPADAFLSLAHSFLADRDLVDLALENVVDAHVHLADKLVEKGRYAEALAEYEWALARCLSSPKLFDDSGRGVLQGLHDLAQSYGPAQEPVRQAYAAARDRMRAGTAGVSDMLLVSTLNYLRDEPQRTLALFDEARGQCSDPAVLAAWTQEVFHLLCQERRYADIAAGMDVAQAVDEILRWDERAAPARADYATDRDFAVARRAHLDDLEQRICTWYQVLIGLERLELADRLADHLLQQRRRAQTLNNLAWAGYLAGRPTEQNVAQARAAYEMSHGNNAAIIDTLARVHAARGERDEALRVLDESIVRMNNPADRAGLEQCRADILDGRP
jgi:tetratricopeptide (TPR) repeat protein